MKARNTKRAALSFYLLTLLLSCGYWFTLLALRLRVEPGSNVRHFPRLLGPMLAAMAVTTVVTGCKALHELFRRIFHAAAESRCEDHDGAITVGVWSRGLALMLSSLTRKKF